MGTYADDEKQKAVARIHDAIAAEVEAITVEADAGTAWLSHWVLTAQWTMAGRHEPFITRVSPLGTDAIVENGLLFEALHKWPDGEDDD